MVEDVAKNVIPIDVKSLKKLGIDEISLVKGQGKDRFHVTKVIHQELNSARINQKKVAEKLNVEERKKVFEILKGNKYTLLKAESKLTEKQKEKFEQSKDLITGTFELIDWLKKAKPYYQNSVKTITRWFGEIVGYFEKKTTSGVVEGINNKLKLIKRSGFGFRNFHNFEMRALLSWHYPIDLAL
jgi:transposase